MTGGRGTGRAVAIGLLGVGVLFASGCARNAESATDGSGSVFGSRATVVAEAWRVEVGRSGAAWRDGFVPLGDLTVLPSQNLSERNKAALGSGRFVLRGALPGGVPQAGEIVYPDGKRATVPLQGAADAFAGLNARRCGPAVPPVPGPGRVPMPAESGSGAASDVPRRVDPTAGGSAGSAGGGVTGQVGGDSVTGGPAIRDCVDLVVTAATLGTTTVRTTRGVATVPAWLFTVTDLPAPVARVAVAPTSVLTLPGPSVPPLPSGPGSLASVERVTAQTDTQIDFVIGIGACDRNPTGQVQESPDVVVIGGTIDRPDGICTAQLKAQPVSVRLTAPLGTRVLLDAVTGRPLVP